jgi:hypothetical protein
MGEIKAYKILSENPRGRDHAEDNITKDLWEVGWGSANGMYVAQGGDQWRDPVNKVTRGEFLEGQYKSNPLQN